MAIKKQENTLFQFCASEGPELISEMRAKIHQGNFQDFYCALNAFELVAALSHEDKISKNIEKLKNHLHEQDSKAIEVSLAALEANLIKTLNYLRTQNPKVA